MIYYTGDIHGSAKGIVAFAQHYELTESDIIVILGDVGANYYGNRRDRYCKDALARIKPTVFCIHGNHERRPDTLAGYKQKEWNGGLVWYEDEYPNLLFARDGDIFTMEGTRHLVIGGAYSVDKYYRLENDLLWFADEQPSAEIKTYVEDQITKNRIDIVLSHTCPYKYEPRDAFLPMIDQSTVDDSTERWLDGIEEKVIVIGNPLKLSPGFPPLHTGHATFTASGVPSSIVSAVIHNHSFTLAKFATLLPVAAVLR